MSGRAIVAGMNSNRLTESRPTLHKAAVAGLKALRLPADVAALRDRDVREIAPKPMLDAVADAQQKMRAKRAETLTEAYGGEA